MKRQDGFSLVELVMVLAISAFAVSIFAPLVVASRAKSRRAECANNLRQIGLAWTEHEQAQNFLPSSGWGWRWIGDPDRGFGETQPGGWAYDVLRFSQYADIANAGIGAPSDREKAAAMLKTVSTPVPMFYCPGRRAVRAYPLVRNGFLAHNLTECLADGCVVTRSDYQANSGNVAVGETGGPSGNRMTFEVPAPYTDQHTGVTQQVTEIRLAQIEDGVSNTICVGEKYLNADNYTDGRSPGDDQCAFSGVDREMNGYTASATSSRDPRPVTEFLPRRDRRGVSLNWTFGSGHESGFYVVNCDTAVKFLNYDIDFLVFSKMGGRADGGAVPSPR